MDNKGKGRVVGETNIKIAGTAEIGIVKDSKVKFYGMTYGGNDPGYCRHQERKNGKNIDKYLHTVHLQSIYRNHSMRRIGREVFRIQGERRKKMFKDCLAEAMREKGLTATELSKMTGISKPSISQYLKGKNAPSAHGLKICIPS